MKRKTIVKQYFFERFFEKVFRSDIRYKNKKLALSNISQQTFLVFQDVFKTSWGRLQRNTFRLPRHLQDVFAIRLPKTSSRRLQDVFKMCLQDVLQLCLQDVFKTSWKTKKCYTEDVFTKTNICWEGRSMSLFTCFPFI